MQSQVAIPTPGKESGSFLKELSEMSQSIIGLLFLGDDAPVAMVVPRAQDMEL